MSWDSLGMYALVSGICWLRSVSVARTLGTISTIAPSVARRLALTTWFTGALPRWR